MLFTFEGIDGSGKSTQARLLAERLRAEAGRDPLLVRDPGGTALSERVRALLLDPDLDVDPVAELLLFSAARAQLCSERVRPALAEGRVVVCDRFYDSTTAYQGAGRALAPDGGPAADAATAGPAPAEAGWLEALHRHATGGLVPDRTYLVALAPEAARARRTARAAAEAGAAADRMESAREGFYARVAAAYERLAQAHPERVKRLDGTRSVEALHEAIWADAAARLSGTAVSGGGSSA